MEWFQYKLWSLFGVIWDKSFLWLCFLRSDEIKEENSRRKYNAWVIFLPGDLILYSLTFRVFYWVDVTLHAFNYIEWTLQTLPFKMETTLCLNLSLDMFWPSSVYSDLTYCILTVKVISIWLNTENVSLLISEQITIQKIIFVTVSKIKLRLLNAYGPFDMGHILWSLAMVNSLIQ